MVQTRSGGASTAQWNALGLEGGANTELQNCADFIRTGGGGRGKGREGVRGGCCAFLCLRCSGSCAKGRHMRLKVSPPKTLHVVGQAASNLCFTFLGSSTMRCMQRCSEGKFFCHDFADKVRAKFFWFSQCASPISCWALLQA